MKQIYRIMLIFLIQSQRGYGMMRTSEDTDFTQNPTAKKMKLDQRRPSSNHRFALGSPMEISQTDQDENALSGIPLSDKDMQEIKDALDAMILEQKERESTMTRESQDEFDRLAIIRAIADDSEEEDETGICSGQDKDW